MQEETDIRFNFKTNSPSIIKVIGVGGGGGNAVNHMYKEGIHDVSFVLCNTDNQALSDSPIPTRLQLGTEGLGAGNRPERARQAAMESLDGIKEMLNDGTRMVFITAGMGGGTGTGAAPVVAKISKELGILTVGVVTKPFIFEGKPRMNNALNGIERLKENVDTLIIIPNDKLLQICDKRTSIKDAFCKADEVLQQGVQGITDLIFKPGLINLDFADIQTVMRDKGIAHIGIGVGSGEDKAVDAIKSAMESPLLETTVSGATDIIINFSGDIGIQEVYEAVSYLTEVAGDEANIIFGNVESEDVPDDEVSITIIATGLHDVSGKGASAVKVRKPAADKNNAESNGPTYSGQAIKTGTGRSSDSRESSRTYDNRDMEIKIPEFLQKRR
mgnify:CR=1 FL=1